MMRARAAIGVFFQVLNASLAEVTAALISASVANGTCASTCWVAGLTTSCHSLVCESISLPSSSNLTVGVCSATSAGLPVMRFPLK
jgi:hypothetical protein